MFLSEGIEYSLHEIDDDTRDVLSLFQEVLATTIEFTHSGNKDARGSFKSIEDFKRYKEELKRFHNYPFAKKLHDHIGMIQKELVDSLQATRKATNALRSSNQSLAAAKRYLLAGNPDGFLKAMQGLKGAAKGANYRTPKDILAHAKNPFYIENPLIFQSTNFLTQFTLDEMHEVIQKDLNKFKYSYMKLPASAHTDYQFIAYFIMELRDEPGVVELESREISKFFQIAFSDKNYADLTKKVRTYLVNNTKSLLPEIFDQMKEFPELVKANKKLCAERKTVYRGVAYSEDFPTTQSIIDHDKKSLVVATSAFKEPAKRFALSYGHLESSRAARTDGVVIEYDVSDDAAVLDVSVFGGIFAEGEVLINPRKAKVVNVREYEREDYEN